MVVIFRKFAITKTTVKVVGGFLAVFLTFLLLAGQGKTAQTKEFYQENVGGRDIAVTVELASLETEGTSEPDELNQPRMLLFSTYAVQDGDVLGGIAKQFGLSTSTVASANKITNSRSIQIGKVLRIPNQDGVFYTPKKEDTLAGIAEKNKADIEKIKAANELFSDTINPNTSLFLPGVTTPWEEQVLVAASRPVARPQPIISARIFDWPASGRITSYYGRRRNPFSRGYSFHDGLDIGAPAGANIRAAGAGRIESVGWDNTYGNFVIIRHADGYKTLYAHMESYTTRAGAYVDAGALIGYVGSTGLSTGAHLHFTVYKDGVTINPRTVLK